MYSGKRAGIAVICAGLLAAAGCVDSDDVEVETAESASVVADGGLPRGSSWSYWDRGGDLDTAWRDRTYDDATWATGAGPLGYGESYLATTVSYGPSASNKYI